MADRDARDARDAVTSSSGPPAAPDAEARWVARLRAEVARLPDVDPRARLSRLAFLREVSRLPRPLDERSDPTHVTVSAVAIGPRGVLLHRHLRLGIWLQPGGHVEPGERPWDAVLREVREETGLGGSHPDGQPQLVHVDVHDAPRGHRHLDVRYLVHADGAPRPPAGESPDVAWFGWDDALDMADPALVGALVRARQLTAAEPRA